MRLFTTFAVGLAARALSILALQVSTWIMEKLADGQGCHHFCQEFKQFWKRLVSSVAAQLSGCRSHQLGEYEEEWRPELFGQ